MPASQRVQASYKVSPETKSRVDLLASALDMEKSRVVEAAVERYLGERRQQVNHYIERARQAVENAPRGRR